jgi:hypothetical protein
MAGGGGVKSPTVAEHALFAHGAAKPPTGPLQWPFVGLAVVLVLFIAATPWLLGFLSNGASSPGTQLIVTVDWTPAPAAAGGNSTHFYLSAISSLTTRYAWINASLSTNVVYYPIPASTRIQWDSSNVTDTLVLPIKTNVNPVVLNVTAEYVDSTGGTEVYYGAYWLNVTSGAIIVEPLTPALGSGPTTLPLTTPSSLPLLSRPVSGGGR